MPICPLDPCLRLSQVRVATGASTGPARQIIMGLCCGKLHRPARHAPHTDSEYTIEDVSKWLRRRSKLPEQKRSMSIPSATSASALRDFGQRMFAVADIDEKGRLTREQFATMTSCVPKAIFKTRHPRADRYSFVCAAPDSTPPSCEEFLRDIVPHITRSVQEELVTNGEGRHAEVYA